jgi:hypothetical protein
MLVPSLIPVANEGRDMTKTTDADPVTEANKVRQAHPGRNDDEIIASLAKQLATATGGVVAGDLLIGHNDLIDLGKQLRSEAAKTLGNDTEVRRNAIYNIVHALAENIGHGLLGGNEAENLHLYCLLMENVVSLQVARDGLPLTSLTSAKSGLYSTDPIAHMADVAVENLIHLIQRRKARQRDRGAKSATASSIDLEVSRLLKPGLSDGQAVAWIRKIKRRLRGYSGDGKQAEFPVCIPLDTPDVDLGDAIDRMVTMIKVHPPR